MNNKNNPKKGEVDTTKKQNVSRFKARQSKASLNDKQLISINTAKAEVVFDSMPTQVQLLIMNIDQLVIDNDKCSLLMLNNKWSDEYEYQQDASTVLAHYLSKFNNLGSKTYKGFTSEELDSMFAKEDIQITDPIDVGDDENHLLNDVKMIQLFYEPDTEQKFREIIDKVKEKYSIDNISDAVLKCVENEQERIK